jgi:nucleotide-binding universal stress UspA family protein
MSYRIILAPLFGNDTDGAALRAAFGVGRRFDAHVRVLFVRIDPLDIPPVVGEGMSPTMIEQLQQASEAEIDRRRAVARARFDSAASAAGVPIAGRHPGPGGFNAEWAEGAGRRDELIPARARLADLTVVARPQSEEAAEQQLAIEATLLAAGRPILLVPPAAPESIGHSVALAWNGSTEAARALACALPFLESARAVHVLAAETRKTRFDLTAEVADYLAWRGIPCERRLVTAEGEAVGAALLHTAAEAGVDLLVMGGYGRSRLRELILGGVTRHVLAHVNLPVLMAH